MSSNFNLSGAAHTAAKTAEEALPGEPTVTMLFPHAVNLTHDVTRQVIKFNAGVNEVPESLADHSYLAAHGVRAHIKPRPQPLTVTAAILAFLHMRGYADKGTPDEQVATAQNMLDKMSLDEQRGFMADFTQNAGKAVDDDVDDGKDDGTARFAEGVTPPVDPPKPPAGQEGVTPPVDPPKPPAGQEGVTPPVDPPKPPAGGSATTEEDDGKATDKSGKKKK